MRAVGIKHKVGFRVLDFLDQRFLDRDHTHRHIAAGQSFAADQDIRHHVPVIDRESPAGAAEAGHHFVGYQDHVVAIANLANLRPVFFYRRAHPPPRSPHLLGYKPPARGRARSPPFFFLRPSATDITRPANVPPPTFGAISWSDLF